MQRLSLECCPDASGAYVVALRIAAPVSVRLGKAAPVALAAGRYLYCGSAYGPGGLRARLGRHFRRDKSIRWHIDQLTTAGDVLGAWAIPQRDECELVRRLGFLHSPIAGFGASDCPDCRSHLLHWPQRIARSAITTALAANAARPLWLNGPTISPPPRAAASRDTSRPRPSPAPE
ncbi:GIY-YIG nuclease family protein [Rhodopseudomonas palustris]|uniref:GIY-YIG nuclease family protein n=1 Tax=Rhodopseudomonas palustris TaxID=1076 RepID=UPI0020CBC7F9|nr:GIY-YIG nuclease family protein [Rhodopseudomonas palustris]MCP9627942.1 GIY-YIG nuclease family protein [Rhodopseudomonas palustris]